MNQILTRVLGTVSSIIKVHSYDPFDIIIYIRYSNVRNKNYRIPKTRNDSRPSKMELEFKISFLYWCGF